MYPGIAAAGQRAGQRGFRKPRLLNHERPEPLPKLKIHIGLLTLAQCFHDENEAQERHKHDIELVEATEDAPEALEPAEQPLDLVATSVPGLAVRPGIDARRFRRHHRGEAEFKGELAGFIAFVRTIHDQATPARQTRERLHQLAAGRRIVRVSRGERERQSRSSIRGNHMNFGGPSASRLADGLRSVFFSAPVPSGCTLTMVLSRLTASMRTRMSC